MSQHYVVDMNVMNIHVVNTYVVGMYIVSWCMHWNAENPEMRSSFYHMFVTSQPLKSGHPKRQ